MSDCIPVSFVRPDLDVFCGLDSLGLRVEGMRHDPPPGGGRPVTITLACRAQTGQDDAFCHACGARGQARDTRIRTFAHLPFGERPTILCVRYRRHRCHTCARVWSQDPSRIGPPQVRLTRSAATWAARALARDRLSVASVSRALGVSWHAAWNAIKHVAAPLPMPQAGADQPGMQPEPHSSTPRSKLRRSSLPIPRPRSRRTNLPLPGLRVESRSWA